MTALLAGQVPTAAELNAPFPVGLDAWQPYTPAWTASGVAPAIGNGSITGAYMKVGRLVVYRIAMTTGSTSTYGTGQYRWSLPVAAAVTGYIFGNGTIVDISAGARFNRVALALTTTTIDLMTEAAVEVGQTVPMTWATGDIVNIQGVYESAA